MMKSNPLLQTLLVFLLFLQSSAQQTATTTPVVGILTQPRGETTNSSNPKEYVIAASYVKWLESGGARSIPIPYDATHAMVEDIFGQINGLLLPGGASQVPQSVHYLLTLAMQEATSHNKKNKSSYFPVWGTCLGFEYLVQVLSNSSTTTTNSILKNGFDAENISLPLEHVEQHQLYADSKIYDMVTKLPITMNNHRKGVEPKDFQNDINLNKLFRITSINHDRKGRPFVSSIESKRPHSLPWYGVQYHPEKNAFEYGTFTNTVMPYEAINHSDEGVEFSTYLARFFVRLTRKQLQVPNNTHAYTKPNQYPLVQTYEMKRGLGFEEYYVIPSAVESYGWATQA